MTTRIAVRHTWISVLGVLLVPILASSSHASPYKITEMYGNAWDLDDLGHVVGSYTIYNAQNQYFRDYTYFYDSNPGGKVVLPGVTSPKGDAPGSYDFGSSVYRINGQGKGVGADSSGHMRLFDAATGQAVPLPLTRSAGASLVDDSGRIYGSRPPTPSGAHAPTYSPFVFENGQTRDLGLPPDTIGAMIVGVNNGGQLLVAGISQTGMFDRAYLLSNGAWTKLGDFKPNGFNDAGDVIGVTMGLGDDAGQGILIPHGTTTPIALETSPGLSNSPWDINNKGEVVGSIFNNGPNDHGFLYSNGVLTDLNTLIDAASGWTIRSGMSINDRGQILAGASKPGAAYRNVLLTPDGLPTPPDFRLPEMPVPEPSTFIVFGVIAAGCAWRRSRSQPRRARGSRAN